MVRSLLASLALTLATLILATTAWAAPHAEAEVERCSTGTGLVVLMGQRTLYLDRPARGASTAKSVWSSFLASALTGGSYLIFIPSGNDRGALLFAPEGTATELLPPSVARSLANALTTTAATSHFDVLAATNEGAVVDAILKEKRCARTLVLNAQYQLEQGRSSLQLTVVSQLLVVPTDSAAPRSTLAVLEYRSAPWDFLVTRDAAVLATAFHDFLADHSAQLSAELHDAMADTALMTSHILLPNDPPSAHVTLASSGIKLLCDDCRRSDIVFSEKPSRAWLQPADTPIALRSLPIKP